MKRLYKGYALACIVSCAILFHCVRAVADTPATNYVALLTNWMPKLSIGTNWNMWTTSSKEFSGMHYAKYEFLSGASANRQRTFMQITFFPAQSNAVMMLKKYPNSCATTAPYFIGNDIGDFCGRFGVTNESSGVVFVRNNALVDIFNEDEAPVDAVAHLIDNDLERLCNKQAQ